MMNDTSAASQNQPPLPVPFPPKPSRWQRFLAFPITRIVLYLIVFALLAFLMGEAFIGLLRVLHHKRGHDQVLMMTLGEGIWAVSAVLTFWIMVRFVDKRPWATAGFGRQGLAKGMLGGFALGAAMLTVGMVGFLVLGLYHVSAVVPSLLVLAPLLTYLCVGVFEETQFRGYLFQTLEERWGSGVALGVSCLLFGLVHLGNPAPGATPLRHLVGPLFLCLEAGLPLGAAYLLTREWWLPIGIHWAWDYFEGPVYGCPDSGTHDPHTLLHAAISGPAILTGGPFGPEAGLVFLAVGTLTGVLLLWAAVKKGRWQPGPWHRIPA